MDFKNHLGLVAYIAAHAGLSLKYKDLEGNVKEILPTGLGNSFDLEEFRKNVFPNDQDTHPSDGDNVYPGSLENGEITGRYILNNVETDPTKVTNLVFQKDVGTNLNMVGDGLEFQGYILKTPIVKGVKGKPVKIPINYDPKNVFKDGCYTSTSPYPINVRSSSFKVDIPVEISLNGIGENISGKNTKAPSVKLTLRSDKSIDVESIDGYENDGASDGNTGNVYQIIVDLVCTYSTQEAVSQLPSNINLFTGSSNGNIALSGASDFFENVNKGVEITLDPYAAGNNPTSKMALSDIGMPTTIRISKERLVNGYKLNLSDIYNLNSKKDSNVRLQGRLYSGSPWDANMASVKITDINKAYIQIGKGTINLTTAINTYYPGAMANPFVLKMLITKVAPYSD